MSECENFAKHYCREFRYNSLCVHVKSLSSVLLWVVTPWIVACQAPLSMGFSRQEYWSRLPWPPPEDLPNPGVKPHLMQLLPYRWILHHWAIWEGHNSLHTCVNIWNPWKILHEFFLLDRFEFCYFHNFPKFSMSKLSLFKTLGK